LEYKGTKIVPILCAKKVKDERRKIIVRSEDIIG